MPAAFSMTMLTSSAAGDAYTLSELTAMYNEAGFGGVTAHPIPMGPPHRGHGVRLSNSESTRRTTPGKRNSPRTAVRQRERVDLDKVRDVIVISDWYRRALGDLNISGAGFVGPRRAFRHRVVIRRTGGEALTAVVQWPDDLKYLHHSVPSGSFFATVVE
jgi:hypothetical protein